MPVALLVPTRPGDLRAMKLGPQVGTLKVLAGDKPLTEGPLVVLEPVEQAGVLGRAWDAVRLWVR